MKPIDVNIYILNLEEGKEPRIEKMPGQIIEDELSGETPLIHYIGPNDFKVWYDDFEVEDLGFTHIPLPNLIELVVKRDTTDKDAVRTIANFCVNKLNKLQAEARLFKKGIIVAASELATIYKEENQMGKMYECNPDKNRSCSKTGCIFNIDSRYKVCHKTANKKYEWFPEFDKARQVKHRTREDI